MVDRAPGRSERPTSRSHAVEVAAVAGGAEGVREVEALVELDPLDPPLLVVGQAAAEPVRLGGRGRGSRRVGEPPGARRPRPPRGRGGGASMTQTTGGGRGAHGRRRTRHRRRCRLEQRRPAARASRRRRSARRRSRARPRASRSAQRRGRVASRSSASASASGSSGGTSRPLLAVRRPARGCRTPAVATTGTPPAIASTSTFGMPSRSPSASTRQASAEHVGAGGTASSSSAWLIGPGEPRPALEAARRDQRAAPPAPSGAVLAGDHHLERRRRGRAARAQASTSTSKPFLATSRPTPSTRSRPFGAARPRAVADAARRSRRSARGRRGARASRARPPAGARGSRRCR